MSEDKSTDEVIEDIKETVEEVVEDVKETVEEAVEAVEDAVDKAKPPLMKLKDEKPMVFYGGIAGILVVLGFIFLSGGGNSVKQHVQTAVSIGQTYTLSAVNVVGDDKTTLKILKEPGSIASFDNSELIVCSAPLGTPVVAKDFKDAFGKSQLFVKVEIQQEAGDCGQGARGWTLKNNLK